MTDTEVREALRSWIAERNPDLPAGEPSDDTPLIERRYLTSLQVTDLLLYVEELRQAPIDPASLRPGVFRSIDAIHSAFFP
ncbi:MAG: hypothetical protein KY412_01075 [Actinobacteria bacterium]|nr:hypothetical protein [Actinomycetota bacterium]